MTNKQLLQALRFVKRKKVSRFNPWPESIDDITIRHARKYGYLDAYEEFDGIVMAQNNFGTYHFVDEITPKGLARLKKG